MQNKFNCGYSYSQTPVCVFSMYSDNITRNICKTSFLKVKQHIATRTANDDLIVTHLDFTLLYVSLNCLSNWYHHEKLNIMSKLQFQEANLDPLFRGGPL